jgi:hypothetical protein
MRLKSFFLAGLFTLGTLTLWAAPPTDVVKIEPGQIKGAISNGIVPPVPTAVDTSAVEQPAEMDRKVEKIALNYADAMDISGIFGGCNFQSRSSSLAGGGGYGGGGSSYGVGMSGGYGGGMSGGFGGSSFGGSSFGGSSFGGGGSYGGYGGGRMGF